MLSINGWDKLSKLDTEYVNGISFKVSHALVNTPPGHPVKYMCMIDAGGIDSVIYVELTTNETNFTVEVRHLHDDTTSFTILYKDWWKPKSIWLRNPKAFFKKIIDEANKQHRFNSGLLSTTQTHTTSSNGGVNATTLWNLNNF
jgi:hypothetical protein